jgi:hypothetical protein
MDKVEAYQDLEDDENSKVGYNIRKSAMNFNEVRQGLGDLFEQEKKLSSREKFKLE